MHPLRVSNLTITSPLTGEPSPAQPVRVGVPIATAIVLAGLRAYKLLLSPFFAGSCRFEPSCSTYMAEAVRRFGVIKGVALGLRRLSRCHPLGRHGFDPVPPA